MGKVYPYLRDAQDDTPSLWCPKCNQPVWRDETLYEWEGQDICPDCFDAVIARAERDERAVLMGASYTRVADYLER